MALIVGVTLAPAIDRTARVERLAFDAILRPTQVRVLPGGKGVNVCRAARRLGAQVATAGICGGHAGRWLIEALEREGLAPRFVSVAAETRTTYVTVDQAGRSMLIYEPAAQVTADDLERLLELLRGESFAGAAWLVCAGSLPQGLPDDAYARVVRLARERGARCLVDTGGVALAQALVERPDVVKVSLAEARAALGAASHTGATEAARRLVERGAQLAVVTDGPRGAAASDGRNSWAIRVPRLAAVNAIGAGDVFNAGLVVTLAAGESVDAALVAAAAAASASVLELGAGEFDPGRAAQLRTQVSIQQVRRGAL